MAMGGSNMLDLPAEIIDDIAHRLIPQRKEWVLEREMAAEHVDWMPAKIIGTWSRVVGYCNDLLNLRLVCKSLAANSLHCFKRAYFITRKHTLSRRSLERLVGISEDKTFGPVVKNLVISGNALVLGNTPCILFELSRTQRVQRDPEWRRSLHKLAKTYQMLLDEQEFRRNTGADVKSLIVALKNLSNCRSVTIGPVDFLNEDGLEKAARELPLERSIIYNVPGDPIDYVVEILPEGDDRDSNERVFQVLVAALEASRPNIDSFTVQALPLNFGRRRGTSTRIVEYGKGMSFRSFNIPSKSLHGIRGVLATLRCLEMVIEPLDYGFPHEFCFAHDSRNCALFLAQLVSVEELELAFPFSPTALPYMSMSKFFRLLLKTMAWPRLETFYLSDCVIDEEHLLSLLRHVQSTLRYLDLTSLIIRKGSWKSVVARMLARLERGELKLHFLALCDIAKKRDGDDSLNFESSRNVLEDLTAFYGEYLAPDKGFHSLVDDVSESDSESDPDQGFLILN